MINSIAGEHIPESIKIKNVYSRYRLDSGITHQKSPAHSLEFRGFLENMFDRFSRLAVPQSTYIPREPQCLSPRPNWDSPPPLLQVFWRGGESQFGRLEKRLSTLSILCGLSKIRENIHIKKGIKIGLDYRCILPVLRKNHTCVIPVSNLWRRWPHDSVRTHEKLFNRSNTFFAI